MVPGSTGLKKVRSSRSTYRDVKPGDTIELGRGTHDPRRQRAPHIGAPHGRRRESGRRSRWICRESRPSPRSSVAVRTPNGSRDIRSRSFRFKDHFHFVLGFRRLQFSGSDAPLARRGYTLLFCQKPKAENGKCETETMSQERPAPRPNCRSLMGPAHCRDRQLRSWTLPS